MRTKQLIVVAWLALFSAACAGATRNPRPHSQAGTVAHGEFVTVPWGTIDDWNIIVAPMQMGVEEPSSEEDNRLLRFRTFATAQTPTAWQVTALYRFAYAADNVNVHWVEGSANYLMVRKYDR